MSALQISTLSRQYIQSRVLAREAGSVINPTTDTVEFALTPLNSELAPADGDWKTGSWDTDNGAYFARISVGPSSSAGVFTVGYYYVWIRITHAPERLVERVGVVQFYTV